MTPSRPVSRLFLLSLCLPSLTCGDSSGSAAGDQHRVFFVGYVYDGAKGVRLDKAHLGSISIRYRDKTIATDIESDGRFFSKEPLPTWQDYSVTIMADGFRPFVSRNPGFDVPMSLAMTDGVAAAATTQTFHVDAFLFPADLKAPKLTITIDKSDELAGGMARPRASGTIRLRPKSASTVDVAGASATRRRWANDEDLLTQTVTKNFSEGRVDFPEGDLVYGVAYQVTVFDVDGYQPLMLEDLIAGYATSRTVTVQPEMRDPLKIVSSNAASCTPPAGSSNAYGAQVKMTFNEAVELVGSTFAEEIDNGVTIAPVSYGGPGNYCPLKTSVSSTAQERGTRVTIDGTNIILEFNPFVGIDTATGCMVPAMLTSVVYSGFGAINVRPAGDSNPLRRRSLATMVQEYNVSQSGGSFPSSSISCPSRF